jgi:hypothetical protein
MAITKITPGGICSDPDCYCDEPGAPRHDRSVYIPLSLLRYLADEACLVLAFLPDGRLWVGDESELRTLADQLEKAEESEVEQWQTGAKSGSEKSTTRPGDFFSELVRIEKEASKMN